MSSTPPIEARERFAFPGQTPPVGYMYAEELDGTVFKFQAPMRHGMMRQLRAWYAAKKLEWPGDAEMESRVEHFTCGFCPDGFCKGGKKREHSKIFSVKSIRDATGFAYKAVRHPELMVSMEEAAARAKVCANCSRNSRGVCVSCAAVNFHDLLAMFERAGRTTPYDSVIDICEVCGCIARLKLHLGDELLALTEKHDWPENCWLRKTPAQSPEIPK